MLTTVYKGDESIERIRRRPTTQQPFSGPIKQKFGNDAVLKLAIPSIAADYNDHMNGVDISDHLRHNIRPNHRQRRGPARALTWGFLLSVALSNSFLLQRLGQPNWKPYKAQSRFLEALYREIFHAYGITGSTRKRYRAGDEFTPFEQHIFDKRGKTSNCLACQGVQIGPRSQSSKKRRPLQQLDANNTRSQTQPPPKKGTTTQWGCMTCDVAICKRKECWYFYHRQNQ